MKIIKANPAGWKVETSDNTFYIGEFGRFGCYGNDGVIYKDEEAFKKGEGVCYVSEHAFYTVQEDDMSEFEFLINKLKEKKIYVTHVALEGHTKEDLELLCKDINYDVQDLFNHLDWMYPETLINEMEE
jgi:hypothetical protein